MPAPARRAIIALATFASTPFLAGCPYQAQALFKDGRDYDRRIPLERIRSVKSLNLPAARADDIDQRFPDSSSSVEAQRARLENAREEFAQKESHDLRIEDARAAVLENNLDLRVQLIAPVIAQEAVNEEEGRFEAVLLANAQVFNIDDAVETGTNPAENLTINLSPGLRVPLRTGGTFEVNSPFSRANRPGFGFATLNPSYTQDLQFSLSQPLLRNAGRRANTFQIRVADLDRQASEARTKLEVIRQVAAADRAYWRLYASRQALTVRVQQYELALEQLERAQRRLNAGAVAEIEVVRAESGVADRIEDIIVAQNDVLLRQRELKQLLNIPGLDVDTAVNVIPMSEPDPMRYDLDAEALADAAVRDRAELLELELNLARDAATVAFQRNQALPLLSLDYTYSINGLGAAFEEAVRVASENRFESWTLGVTAEVPLGNAQRKAAVQQAVLTRLQRLATQDARRQSIRREVLDAVDNIDSGWQRILAARQAVALNTRTLEAEQRQFDVGRSTSTDVLDADAQLAESRLAEIQAVVDYQISQIDLAFATGTLLGAAKIEWGPLDPRGTDIDDGGADAKYDLHPVGRSSSDDADPADPADPGLTDVQMNAESTDG